MRIGAEFLGGGRCSFVVWAPRRQRVEVRIVSPGERILPMERDRFGYWRAEADGVEPGTRYLYRLDGQTDRPDPASHHQPEGVHGPSEVVDHGPFPGMEYRARDFSEWVIYEFHVGSFTSQGTFAAAVDRLDELADLGINAMEIMPVAQFSGHRNWGYDGVYPFAVQASYGGPAGLREFVAACHARDMAVILDVVYNHFGPEGNYSSEFGPYFNDNYRTPWGQAVNFDSFDAHGVRNFFVQNARHWLGRYGLDGLRLDAVHSIYDLSARHILRDLAETVEDLSRRTRRRRWLIAESDLNDPRFVRRPELGGFGLDAIWNDDFHHSLHALVTGERQGYYQAFGRVSDLAESYQRAFVYRGRFNPFRGREYGAPADDCLGSRFVVFSQNHDQVGNRMLGDRLSTLVSFDMLKVVAGVVLLSPFVPMLFMGEEYGEDKPFMYFVSHQDEGLVEAVRTGRRAEFESFAWLGEPPDPQSEDTFFGSALEWDKRSTGLCRVLLDLHRELIGLRRTLPALRNFDREGIRAEALEADRVMLVLRPESPARIGRAAFAAFNFSQAERQVCLGGLLPDGRYRKVLDSAEKRWRGPGSGLPADLAPGASLPLPPVSFAVYERTVE